MSKISKQCPFRQDKLCIEEECQLWNTSAKNCVINVGIATLISLFNEITEEKRAKKERKKGIVDRLLKAAEGAVERAFEPEEPEGK